MAPRDIRLCICALALIALSVPILGGNESAPPQRVTPTLGVISKISKFGNSIICEWTSTRFAVTTENGPGGAGRRIAGCFDSAPVSVYEVRGNRLSPELVARRVKAGDVVVVSEDGQMPERRYLQVFKEDVVVLVPVALDAPLTPVSAGSDPKGRIPPQILPRLRNLPTQEQKTK